VLIARAGPRSIRLDRIDNAIRLDRDAALLIARRTATWLTPRRRA
jgi:hypothetical protein